MDYAVSLSRYRWLLACKRLLTTAQIVQFLLILGHTALQMVVEDCGFPVEQTVAQIFLVLPLLTLFVNFYAKEYVTRSNAKKREVANGYSIRSKED